jgi:hypothetical protein
MDFEWINGVNCLSKEAWEGCLSLWWFWIKNLSTQIGEGESCLPAEDEHPGVLFVGEAGRPGPTGLGGYVPPLVRLSSR